MITSGKYLAYRVRDGMRREVSLQDSAAIVNEIYAIQT
jgi:hypothetical protein